MRPLPPPGWARPALAAVLLAALTGCASGGGQGHPTGGGSTTPSPSPVAVTSTPLITPSAPASTALGAGQRVWAAFSQRGLPYAEWWGRLKPLLSDGAQAQYVYDDPRKLPVMRMTGSLHVAAKAPAQPHYTAEVVVPTSKGTFRLDLERHTMKSPWLLYAIRFPRSVH